jgi:hypothetical protein
MLRLLSLSAIIFAAFLGGCTRPSPITVAPQKSWPIGILEGTFPLLLDPENLGAPRLTWRDNPGIPARFVADPFFVRYGEKWLLFLRER